MCVFMCSCTCERQRVLTFGRQVDKLTDMVYMLSKSFASSGAGKRAGPSGGGGGGGDTRDGLYASTGTGSSGRETGKPSKGAHGAHEGGSAAAEAHRGRGKEYVARESDGRQGRQRKLSTASRSHERAPHKPGSRSPPPGIRRIKSAENISPTGVNGYISVYDSNRQADEEKASNANVKSVTPTVDTNAKSKFRKPLRSVEQDNGTSNSPRRFVLTTGDFVEYASPSSPRLRHPNGAAGVLQEPTLRAQSLTGVGWGEGERHSLLGEMKLARGGSLETHQQHDLLQAREGRSTNPNSHSHSHSHSHAHPHSHSRSRSRFSHHHHRPAVEEPAEPSWHVSEPSKARKAVLERRTGVQRGACHPPCPLQLLQPRGRAGKEQVCFRPR